MNNFQPQNTPSPTLLWSCNLVLFSHCNIITKQFHWIEMNMSLVQKVNSASYRPTINAMCCSELCGWCRTVTAAQWEVAPSNGHSQNCEWFPDQRFKGDLKIQGRQTTPSPPPTVLYSDTPFPVTGCHIYTPQHIFSFTSARNQCQLGMRESIISLGSS